jgi:predicted metal-dependent HD superfamily phosphohydrolase
MATNSKVPPADTDKSLFRDMPQDIQALNAQARKEARLAARREYVNRYGYPQQRKPNRHQ